VVAVEANRYFMRSTVTQLVTQVLEGMSDEEEYGPAELREFVGLSRKFLIPFLEFCDREGYTIRNGLGRRRRGTELAK
jgi:selenocysteine-specific elongation factor